MAILSNKEITDRLENLGGWVYLNNQIEKEFELKDFKSALNLLNRIGDEAEKMNHHPDILLHSWNKLKITISTHNEGGVTEKDFKLAKKIEEVYK